MSFTPPQLTPDQIAQLRNLPTSSAGGPTTPWNLSTPGQTYESQQRSAQEKQTKQQQAAAQKSAQQKIQDTLNQLNNMIAGASYTQVSGTGAAALGSQIGQLLATLPNATANQWLNQHSNTLKNTPLGNAITTSAQQTNATGATAQPQKPIWDPLALQTMWHDVFGPAFTQASKLAGNVGPGYLAGMQQAIAGSNASPQQRQQLSGDALATANLLQQVGKTGTQAAAAQIPFDSLIAALQQASGAAQLAQGEAQKQIAYGQTAMTAPLFGGTTGSSGTGALNTAQAGNLLNSALGGSSALTPAAAINANQTNPLMPNFPGYIP